jgi:hypothetical protein
LKAAVREKVLEGSMGMEVNIYTRLRTLCSVETKGMTWNVMIISASLRIDIIEMSESASKQRWIGIGCVVFGEHTSCSSSLSVDVFRTCVRDGELG